MTITFPTVRPSRRFVLLLACTAALTLLADFLLYGHRPGLGLAVFLAALWTALAIHRHPATRDPKDLLLPILLVASAWASAVAPSGANLLVLIAITFYASGHWLRERLSPYWARALQGLRAFISVPSLFKNLGGGVDLLLGATESNSLIRGTGGALRLLRVVAPVLLVLLPFVVLLGAGNAILGHAIDDAFASFLQSMMEFQLPSEWRVMFWVLVAGSTFALLGNPAPQLAPINIHEEKAVTPPADPSIPVWRTRLLLLAVNALFFIANATDIRYLWFGSTDLPHGVSYSAFVHEGVNNLIASVVLAAIVLLLLFRQARVVTEATGQRPLAWLWIAQNLMLVGGVLLRLNLYVDAYGLSVLRVHLMMFLVLVSVGFVLLAIRIWQRRSLLWLIGGNLLATFALFFTGQFLNVRGMVAAQHVLAVQSGQRSPADLDLDYLLELAPESWPALLVVAENRSQFGGHAVAAAEFLGVERDLHAALAAAEDWRSWSLRLARLRREGLPDFQDALEKRLSASEKAPISSNRTVARH